MKKKLYFRSQQSQILVYMIQYVQLLLKEGTLNKSKKILKKFKLKLQNLQLLYRNDTCILKSPYKFSLIMNHFSFALEKRKTDKKFLNTIPIWKEYVVQISTSKIMYKYKQNDGWKDAFQILHI